MAYTLEMAKTLLGIAIADTVKDAAIQRTLDTVITSFEAALGRGLLLKCQKIRFYNTDRAFMYIDG